jgi:AcrR family transcriptional regulator
MTTATGRRRGRPASHDITDRRAAILAAARARFARDGFVGTSMRAIARDAGVDPALINHYFGDKAGLLVATMELPFNPIETITGVLAGGRDGLAERIITTFLTTWDQHPEVFATLVRTAFGSPQGHAPVLELARNVIIDLLRSQLTGPNKDLRATLIAAHIIGLGTMRYVARLEPVASAPVAALVNQYAPSMQKLISEPH